MERGASYTLHEDGRSSHGQGQNESIEIAQKSPLVHRRSHSSSGYQPPMVPGVKTIDMPTATKRVMDRDPLFQRSRGRWKYVSTIVFKVYWY